MLSVLNSDLQFDIELATEYVDAFSTTSKLGCSILSINGDPLANFGKSCQNCTLCDVIFTKETQIGFDKSKCFDAHIYGMLQAERFGGKYIYFCPLGLTYFVSPIMNENSTVGIITAGPLLMVDIEDYIKYDLIEALGVPAEMEKTLFKIVEDIPKVPPEIVSKFSTLLFMTAGFIGNISKFNQLIIDQDSGDIQSHITELVGKFKVENLETNNIYPFEKERELQQAIIDGDKQSSQRLLNDILGYVFFSSSGKFEVIRARILELLVLLSRSAVDGGADADRIFGLNHKYITEINNIKTVDELCVWLSRVMAQFTDNVFRYSDVKHIDVIRKAVDYIRRNYSQKITLDDVATHVYLSPSYFSKVFKDEMGGNFNEFLNKVRIDKSKKMLLNEDVKLVDIPGIVGFEDQSYFSKVFKKLTGTSPGKYRESRGRTLSH